jgi:hypothetical protein
MIGVTWIPWTEEHNVLARYKKNCTFCVLPATVAACSRDKNKSHTAIIRCCDDLRCRALAIKLALGVTHPEKESN